MAGTILITGANSSAGIPAVKHILQKYPQYTLILAVRDASASDPNTERLRSTIASFSNPKASIRALDLASLEAVRNFAHELSSEISKGQLPPLYSIVAIAYYWNLVGNSEITADGFDKTMQVSHISHAALILRMLGSFHGHGHPRGRIVLLSSDSHWPGKNNMEVYPPVIPEDMNKLIKPVVDDDKQGRGYQQYATGKLAITTWMYALNRHLQKDPKFSAITAIAMNPGNLVDSRALTTNTPVSMHRLQTFVFKPLRPLLSLMMGPTLRTAGPAGVDIAELAFNPDYAGDRGFYTLLEKDESSPESRDEVKQEALWEKTLEWSGVGKEDTALKNAFGW